MNTSPNALKVVCYGDSNTWGSGPWQGIGSKVERYELDVRWPGLLQNKLGDKYDVVEEGFPGRTLFTRDPQRSPLIVAKNTLELTFSTHNDANMVVVALGTNDIWEDYNNTSEEICEEYTDLLVRIKSMLPELTKLICIGPVVFSENFPKEHEKSKEVNHLLEKKIDGVAAFLDMAKLDLELSRDGVHLSKAAHTVLADAIVKQIN